jgi:hypothetical protein
MDIYTNPRAWRVRIAQVAVFIGGALIVWLAFFSDGRVGSAAEQYFVWALGALGLVLMAGTEFYLRAYVVRISRDWRVTTLSFFGERSFSADPTRIRFGAERHDISAYRQLVNNFWMPMRVPGEVLPLIVDTTPPARFDKAAFQRSASAPK